MPTETTYTVTLTLTLEELTDMIGCAQYAIDRGAGEPITSTVLEKLRALRPTKKAR